MEVEYSSKFRKLYENRKNFNRKETERIETALFVLTVASCLAEVPDAPPTRRHKLVGDRAGCWALNISPSKRMIIEPINGTEPRNITAVRILEIVDYH